MHSTVHIVVTKCSVKYINVPRKHSSLTCATLRLFQYGNMPAVLIASWSIY